MMNQYGLESIEHIVNHYSSERIERKVKQYGSNWTVSEKYPSGACKNVLAVISTSSSETFSTNVEW